MKTFITDDFLLQNKFSERLYHEHAAKMPIIDYHSHLPADEVAANKQFANITQVWLYGDHYKWRAMRANGVSEDYCTGTKTDWEKFEQWAATVPYTLRNSLHHWTHLELLRYFQIDDLLDSGTAKNIYERANELLQTPAYTTQGLLQKMQVHVSCTTDDPLDNLEHHIQIKASGFATKVLPTFRPDKAMAVSDAAAFNNYVNRVEAVTSQSITTYEDYIIALKSRHDFFGGKGCKLADHGLSQLCTADYTEAEVKHIFGKIRSGNVLSPDEQDKLASALLAVFAEWNHEKGWAQQFHLGAIRNNNGRAFRTLGPDTGFDSIGDFAQAQSLSRFLSRMDSHDKLGKTILYNLDPAYNEIFATMAGNFNDGTIAGKVQYGAAWWFLDQKDGMTRQLNALSNMGLLSRFVGMLTDSRSFLSFPRHEYFRRILCNILGTEIANGELPEDMAWIGQIVENICYNNAQEYFGF